jgi:CYTH domain-containing protein
MGKYRKRKNRKNKEIERKWIAIPNSKFVDLKTRADIFRIDQYYTVSNDDEEIRYRRVVHDPFNTGPKVIDYFKTRKFGIGIERIEEERGITEKEFSYNKKFMLNGSVSIAKIRSKVSINGYLIEVDQFIVPDIGDDNVLVEIEFRNRHDASNFDTNLIEKFFDDIDEVTNEPCFKNKNIAFYVDDLGNYLVNRKEIGV